MGYGFSTKLWHMVASECIGFGVLGAGNLATVGAAMDDIFSSDPDRAAAVSARNLMWSSVTGCLGPLAGAALVARAPLFALSVMPATLFFCQALLFALGPETLEPSQVCPLPIPFIFRAKH